MIYALLPLGIVALAVLLKHVWPMLPSEWRKNKTWDRFMCLVGSHRDLPTCPEGCCFRCVRCNPELFEGVREIRQTGPRSIKISSDYDEDDFFMY
jgi:hypothetical protein